MVAIVDYGMGNLRSVQKAVNRLGFECIISRDTNKLNIAEKLIIPGVGHFAKGMSNLREFKLIEFLNEFVLHQKRPTLGICLGMQLMTDFSEEGNSTGLGWIKGKTVKFKLTDLKVPHIGWNSVELAKPTNQFIDITNDNEFYFVHSYYIKCFDRSDVLFKSYYGITFDSGIMKENIYGFQFHPEKSHLAGLKLLKHFLSK